MKTRLTSGATGTPALTARRAAIVLLMMVLTTMTAWANSPWGTPGSGTANDPYQISTPQQWKKFARLVNIANDTYGDKCYKLTADIEVTGTFSDAEVVYVGGLASRAFRGTFDGGGHTLTFNFLARDGGAPFQHISGATIRNLRVAGQVNVGGHDLGGRKWQIAALSPSFYKFNARGARYYKKMRTFAADNHKQQQKWKQLLSAPHRFTCSTLCRTSSQPSASSICASSSPLSTPSRWMTRWISFMRVVSLTTSA